MSYHFMITGMRDDLGIPHFDYSRDVYNNVDDTFLSDGTITPGGVPTRYRTAWFMPLVPGTLAYLLSTPPATRFCGGVRFPDPLPDGCGHGLHRGVDTADGIGGAATAVWSLVSRRTSTSTVSRTASLRARARCTGCDWANIRLNQTGAGRNARGLSSGVIRRRRRSRGGDDSDGADLAAATISGAATTWGAAMILAAATISGAATTSGAATISAVEPTWTSARLLEWVMRHRTISRSA